MRRFRLIDAEHIRCLLLIVGPAACHCPSVSFRQQRCAFKLSYQRATRKRWYATCEHSASAVQNNAGLYFREKDFNMRTFIALFFAAAVAFAANAVAGVGGWWWARLAGRRCL